MGNGSVMNFTYKRLSLVLLLIALSVAFALYFALNNLRERDPVAAQGSPAEVSFSAVASTTVAEGEPLTLAVGLSSAPVASVDIPIMIENTAGSDGASPVIDQDYTLTGDNYAAGVLRFPAGSQSQDLVFTALNDDDDDDDEVVTLGFGTLPSGVNMASSSVSVSLTIGDDPDDVPFLTLVNRTEVFPAMEGGDNGLTDVELAVNGTPTPPERLVRITVMASADSTASSADYSFETTNLEWPADFAGFRDIRVFPVNDNEHEPTETVILVFSTDDPRIDLTSLNDEFRIFIPIEDNDPPPPPDPEAVDIYFESASGGVIEVEEGQELEIATINLERDPMRTVAIDIGTAGIPGSDSGNPGQDVVEMGTDYTITPTTVVFTPGETSKPLSFTAIDDSFDDDGESVEISFMNLPRGITLTEARADTLTVNILDNDDPGVTLTPVVVSFEVPSSGSYTVPENVSQTITVNLDRDPMRSVAINIAAVGIPGPDGDTVEAGADYFILPTPTILNFESGETSKTFSFNTREDDVDDDGEVVVFSFMDPLPAGVTRAGAGSGATLAVNIQDDDYPEIILSFSAAAYEVTEGGAGATIVVESDVLPEREIDIVVTPSSGSVGDVRRGGTPLLGTPISGSIAADQRTFTFELEAVNDDEDDDGESVSLALDSPTTGVSVFSPNATVNIIDNDDPSDFPELIISPFPAIGLVTEGDDRQAEINVRLVAGDGTPTAPERVVTLAVAAHSSSTASPDDYELSTTVLEFSAGNPGPVSVFITAVDDEVVEGTEILVLGFTSIDPRINVGSATQSRENINIFDDDSAMVFFDVSTSAVTTGEDSSVNIPVMVDSTLRTDLAIPITVTTSPGSDGEAPTEGDEGDYTLTGSNYDPESGELVIIAGETGSTIVFTANGDDDDDDDEIVTLRLGSPSLSTNTGEMVEVSRAIESVQITIEDDPADVPEILLGASIESTRIAEGAETRVDISLTDSDGNNIDPERAVTVMVTAGTSTTAQPEDYSLSVDMLTFPPGSVDSQSLILTATSDGDDEEPEMVVLSASTTDVGVTNSPLLLDPVTITVPLRPVVVSFEVPLSGSYTVGENAAQTITVNLDQDPMRSVAIDIVATGIPGSDSANSGQDVVDAGVDYSITPTTLNFDVGETVKTFSFMALDDTIDDDGEMVELSFSDSLPEGVTRAEVGSGDTLTVNIEDDDYPDVTLMFSAATYNVTEGGAGATIVVEADVLPERALSIAVTPTGALGDVQMDDTALSPTPILGSIAADQRTFTFDLEAVDDTVDDDNESVSLTLSSSTTAGVSIGSPGNAVVNIIDDEGTIVPVEVFFSAPTTLEVAEGESGMVTVTLNADPERTVVIPIAITGGAGRDGEAPTEGATAPGDYTLSHADYNSGTGDLTFSSGETSKTLTFAATDDEADDDAEVVTLGFATLPSGVTASGSNDISATITIEDDDDPAVTLSFSAATYDVTEGGAGATVVVEADVVPERTLAIVVTPTGALGDVQMDGTALSSTPILGFIPPDQTTFMFELQAFDDEDDDDGESVNLALSSPTSGVSIGSPGNAVVNIIDDEASIVPVDVFFSFPTSINVAEGESGMVTVTLSADPEREVVIPIDIAESSGRDGDAPTEGGTAPGDYTLSHADYNSGTGGLTFRAGETSKELTFTATADDVDDDAEVVILGFGSSLPDGVTASGVGNPLNVAVTITDDDDPVVTLGFSAATYTVEEGGTVAIGVTLSTDPERSLVIPLVYQPGRQGSDLSAAGSSDYTAPASLMVMSGELSYSFIVDGLTDGVDDDGESVNVRFATASASFPPGVQVATASAMAVVMIEDEDYPDVTLSFSQPTYDVTEGAAAPIVVEADVVPERALAIVVTPSGDVSDVRVDGTPLSTTPISGTIPADQTTFTFDLEAIDDTVDDDDESVNLALSLSSPTSGVSIVSPTNAIISIIDNDFPEIQVFFFQSGPIDIGEGNSTFVNVRLSAVPERQIDIPIIIMGEAGPDGQTPTEGGTAPGDYTLSHADYNSATGRLTFRSGETDKRLTFRAVTDDIDDDEEEVVLSFGALPTRVTQAPSNESITVRIGDDDDPEVTVSFGQPSYNVHEGGDTVAIRVTLSADPERDLEILLAVTSAPEGGDRTSADPLSDYELLTTSVRFSSGGQQSVTFDIVGLEDEEDDDGESVVLGFVTLPDRVSAAGTTTIAIIDNDIPGLVTASFDESEYTVLEGGNVDVTLRLSQPPDRVVIIPLTVGGDAASDISVSTTALSFSADQVEATVSLTATDNDSLRVENLLGTLSLGTPDFPAGYVANKTVAVRGVTAGIIIVDDELPRIQISFDNAGPGDLTEGDEVNIMATLTAIPQRTVSIDFTVDRENGEDSAHNTADTNDYILGTLQFGADNTRAVVTFTARDDDYDDDGERFTLAFDLTPPALNGITLSQGAVTAVTIGIIDNDVPQVTLDFSASSYTVNEGNNVTVAVRLNRPPEREISVEIAHTALRGTDGEAPSFGSGADYNFDSTTLTFGADDESQSFAIRTEDDSDDDDDERVRLNLEVASEPRVSIGLGEGEAFLNIEDNDYPEVMVSFRSSSYTVDEGGSDIEVTVDLSHVPDRQITVPVTVVTRGRSSSLSTGFPVDLTFGTSAVTQSFRVAAPDDGKDEDKDPVILGLDLSGFGADDRISRGNQVTTAINIMDDDVSVFFSELSYTVGEGFEETIAVRLSEPAPRALSLYIEGYAGLSTNEISFSIRETAKIVSVRGLDDADSDDESPVTLRLVSSSSGSPGIDFGSSQSLISASLTVLDDDRQNEFVADPPSVPGGSSSPRARVDVNVRGASGSKVRELDESAGGTVVFTEFTARLPRPEPFGIDFASGTVFDITPRDSSGMRIETFEPDVIDVCLPVTSDARLGVEGSLSRLRMYYLETDMDGSPVEGATWQVVAGATLDADREHVCANITQFSLFALGFVELEEDDSRRARLLPPTGGISVSSVWLFVLFSLGGLLVTSGSIWLAVSRRRVFTSR